MIISSGREATATAWGVTPHAQNTGSSPSRTSGHMSVTNARDETMATF